MQKPRQENMPFSPLIGFSNGSVGHNGELFKLGDSVGRWNKRYFVLEENRLIHFRDHAAKTPTRILLLSQCQISGKLAQRALYHTFEIANPYDKSLVQPYVLGALNEAVAQEWLDLIKLAAERSKSEQTYIAQNSLHHLPDHVRNLLNDSHFSSIGTDKYSKWKLHRVGTDQSQHFRKDFNWHATGRQLGKLFFLLVVMFSFCESIPSMKLVTVVFFSLSVWLAKSSSLLQKLSLELKVSFAAILLEIILSGTFPKILFVLSISFPIFMILVSLDANFAKTLSFCTLKSRVTMSCNYNYELIAAALLDDEKRLKWDPRCIHLAKHERKEFSRLLICRYASLLPSLNDSETLISEEWYNIAPQTIVVSMHSTKSKNIGLSDDRYVSSDTFEAAWVISAVPDQEKALVSLVVYGNSSIGFPDYAKPETLSALLCYLDRVDVGIKRDLRLAPLGGALSGENEQLKDEAKEYRNQLREVLNICKDHVFCEPNDPRYKLTRDNKDLKIWTRTDLQSASVLGMKAECVLNSPANVAAAFIGDINNKVKFDNMCAKGYFAYEYNHVTKLLIQQMFGIWPISPADFLSVASIFTIPSGVAIVTKSVVNSMYPENLKYTRAEILFAGYIFEELSPTTCKVTYVMESDMKLSLPKLIQNQVYEMQAANFRTIDKLLQDIDHSAAPKREQLIEWIQEVDTVSDDTAENPDVKTDIPKSVSLAKPDNELLELKNSLEDAFDAVELAYREHVSEWAFIKETNDVKVYQKKEDREMPPTLGIGRMKASPLTILHLVRDLSKRREYDDLFDKGETLLELDPAISVMYSKFKGVWPVSARDFCTVSGFKIQDDGTVIYAQQSVTHSKCPSVSGCVRGKIEYGGFVAKPIGNENTELCWVAALDLSGSIPGFLRAQLSLQQPGVVKKIRKLVEGIPENLEMDAQATKAFIDSKNARLSEFQIPIESETQSVANSRRQSIDANPILQLDVNYLEMAERLVSLLLEVTDAKLSWSFLNGPPKTIVSQRSHKSSNIVFVKTEGRIHAAPNDVAGVLCSLSRRSWFDKAFEGELVAVLDTHTWIHQASYFPEGCRSKRNVVILTHWTSLPDGRILVVHKTTAYPFIHSSSIKTEANLVGWIIQADVQNQNSWVSYITHLDIEGISSTAYNAITKEQQPQIVRNLDKFFRNMK